MDIQPGFDPIDSGYVGVPLDTRWYDMRTDAEYKYDQATVDDLNDPELEWRDA